MKPPVQSPSKRGEQESFCACGEELRTPYERRSDKCYECERVDDRLLCDGGCGRDMGWYYSNGRPRFCSDACEAHYYDEAAPMIPAAKQGEGRA